MKILNRISHCTIFYCSIHHMYISQYILIWRIYLILYEVIIRGGTVGFFIWGFSSICEFEWTSIRPNTEYSAKVAEYPKLRENGQKPQKFRQNWLKITWNQHDSKLHYLISRVFLSKPLQKSFSSFFPWNQIQEKFQKCNFTIFSVKTTSNMLDESISRIFPWNQLQNNIFVHVLSL